MVKLYKEDDDTYFLTDADISEKDENCLYVEYADYEVLDKMHQRAINDVLEYSTAIEWLVKELFHDVKSQNQVIDKALEKAKELLASD